MRKLTLILMLLLTLSFYGCSNKPVERVTETIYQREYIPLEALKVSCNVKTERHTPRLLAIAWRSEKTCREAYQTLVEGLIKNHTKEGSTDDNDGRER